MAKDANRDRDNNKGKVKGKGKARAASRVSKAARALVVRWAALALESVAEITVAATAIPIPVGEASAPFTIILIRGTTLRAGVPRFNPITLLSRPSALTMTACAI